MCRKARPFEIVSEATLADSDIIKASIRFLESCEPEMFSDVIEEGEYILGKFGNFGYITYLGIDEQEQDEMYSFIYDSLYYAMTELCPRGCYYGNHPDDGALIGYFPNLTSPLWS